MTKIQIFLEMVRDSSLLLAASKPALFGCLPHVKAVSFVMLNARQLTNYIESTDIPMEVTVAEYIAFAYAGGPKPRLLEMNGL